MPEISGHNLHLSNPMTKQSTPGEFHNPVAEELSEIERLKLALRIAVEEIQAAPHAHDCDFITNRYGQIPWKSFTGATCSDPTPFGCGRCEKCLWLQNNPPTKGPCNCWKASALERMERVKATGQA